MKKSKLKEIIKSTFKEDLSGYEKPQPGGAWELDGVIGFILTGGSKNPENWVFSPQQTEPGIYNVSKKFPYLAVANKLVRPKDHKPEGFGDYLKAGGRDWD